jgi:FhuF 2Fe-2S C-terminal domain/Ferric iron reductase FhuF-like transporter
MPVPVAQALAEVAELGPYFVIVTDPAEEADPTWRRLDALGTGDLRRLIAAYAHRLGGAEERVAASILFQALASRLWSPVVACAAGYGVVPDLTELHWRWAPGAPIALWLAHPADTVHPAHSAGTATLDPAARYTAVHAAVVEGRLRPLREVFAAVVKLADGLVWGNAASALAGTLHAGSLRPELAEPLTGLVRALFTLDPLAGTGEFTRGFEFTRRSPDRPFDGVLRPDTFRRRSCCLYYRVPPGGGMCGDCALLSRAKAAGTP